MALCTGLLNCHLAHLPNTPDSDPHTAELHDPGAGVQGRSWGCSSRSSQLGVPLGPCDVVRVGQLEVTVRHDTAPLDADHWPLLRLLQVGDAAQEVGHVSSTIHRHTSYHWNLQVFHLYSSCYLSAIALAMILVTVQIQHEAVCLCQICSSNSSKKSEVNVV